MPFTSTFTSTSTSTFLAIRRSSSLLIILHTHTSPVRNTMPTQHDTSVSKFRTRVRASRPRCEVVRCPTPVRLPRSISASAVAVAFRSRGVNGHTRLPARVLAHSVRLRGDLHQPASQRALAAGSRPDDGRRATRCPFESPRGPCDRPRTGRPRCAGRRSAVRPRVDVCVHLRVCVRACVMITVITSTTSISALTITLSYGKYQGLTAVRPRAELCLYSIVLLLTSKVHSCLYKYM